MGGFLIPQNKIDQLIVFKHLLKGKQKGDILNSLESGGKVKTQQGVFLGALLASSGVPLAIEAFEKMT